MNIYSNTEFLCSRIKNNTNILCSQVLNTKFLYNVAMNFSERLKELRADKQCTQRQLAYFLGLTPNSVCEWENNRSEPSIETLLKIATYFEVSTDYLLGLEDDFGTPTATPMNDLVLYSEEEKRLIEDYRALNYSGKKLVKQTVETLKATSAQSEQKKNKIS